MSFVAMARTRKAASEASMPEIPAALKMRSEAVSFSKVAKSFPAAMAEALALGQAFELPVARGDEGPARPVETCRDVGRQRELLIPAGQVGLARIALGQALRTRLGRRGRGRARRRGDGGEKKCRG